MSSADQGKGTGQVGGSARDAFYNRPAASKSNAIEVPQLSLSSGGGALKGIDEKLTVNAVNGTASFAIPLPLTPARGAPAISLSYDSGSGNGAFGIGWALDLSSIHRKRDKNLPRYLDDDVFVLAGGDDLVPVRHDDGTTWETAAGKYRIKRFRPRVEGSFARIEQVWPEGADSFYWKVTRGDNSVVFYGFSDAARIGDPRDPRKVARWLPELGFDDKGNVVAYGYKREDGAGGGVALHDRNRYDEDGTPRFANRYLKSIRYGNREPWPPAGSGDLPEEEWLFAPKLPDSLDFSFETLFDYGEHGTDIALGDADATIHYQEQTSWSARADAFSDHRNGFETRTLRLCRRVLVFHRFEELGGSPCLIRSLDLQYASSMPDTVQPTEVTYLVSACARGYSRASSDTYAFTSLPGLRCSYQPLRWQTQVHELAPESALNLPEGLSDSYQWVDLYGEGIAGVLSEQNETLYYKSNLGDGAFTAACVVASRPSFRGMGKAGLSIQDLDADGSRQLVCRAPGLQGYFEIDDSNRWQGFQPFAQRPTVDVAAPNVLQLDLDGDGRPDLLVTEECAVRWYPSLGRAGHAEPEIAPRAIDEEDGPLLLWNDPVQRIFLADLSGDGLSDIVRIRNGEVCYWPNLGYGQFGAKIAMDDAPVFAPPEQFDPRYLHLADVTGTGATDLLYLDGPNATVWLNLSGNGWSAPLTIALPDTVSPNRLSVCDLLGHGTACLVWSSPLPGNSHAPLRYVDLLDGKKPHLLVGYDNGTGKQTTLSYRSSTQSYLADKRAGTPWQTRLPFPVQCLVRVEVVESVTNAVLVQEYSYHHGYYDHGEREFRGFARVDQRDTESFARWVRKDASNLLDEGFHQPVVLTRTWYHTGARSDGDDPLGLYRADYWSANPALLAIPGMHLLPEPSLPPGRLPAALAADEVSEAFRACKGTLLRREVFALDAPEQGASDAQRAAELIPLSVATHSCQVQLLQPGGANHHAVFQVRESEALTLTYERTPGDARVTHTLVLELDQYGNALASATVMYGRRLVSAPAGTPAEVWQAQKARQVTLTETTFTDDIFTSSTGVYRLPTACETKMFEITGVAPTSVDELFRLTALKDAGDGAAALAYHEVPPPDAQPRKRLIESQRTLFLANDLASPLAFRTPSPLGLGYQSYQLALTAPLLRQLFPETKIADAVMADLLGVEGKYLQLGDSDPGWWIGSGTVDYLDPVSAPRRFYQPAGYLDAQGSRTDITYFGEDATRVNAGAHWELLAGTRDPVGNETRALRFDFRHLKPTRIEDRNGNRSAVAFDDVGRCIAAAAMGKGGEADSLDALESQLADRVIQEALTARFLAEAGRTEATALLQDATVRWVYDHDHLPMSAARIARERHGSDLANIGSELGLQLTFEYTGGAGNVVMTKSPAAPGEAWTLDAQDQKLRVENASPRWVGSGRTVFSNKGKPVKQYEPYFSVTHRYESDRALTDVGVAPLLTYDAMGRHVRTDLPDGSYHRTQFDAWWQQLFDANDTVMSSRWYAERMALPVDDPRRRAAIQTELHDGTPLALYLDSLGRAVCSVAHNRGKNAEGVVEESRVRIWAELDIESNVLRVTDPRDNIVIRHGYDMLGRVLYQWSADAGERWTLPDASGTTLYSWDSRGQRLRNTYDAMGRPLDEWLSVDGGEEILLGQTIWGEAAPGAGEHNLRGQVWKRYDQAGEVVTVAHDLDDNLLESRRRFTLRHDRTIAWPEAPDAILETETFRNRSEYDALGRITRSFSPDTSTRPASELIPGYDEGGRLGRMDVKLRGSAATTAFVTDISYDAKGQRLAIRYGNGVETQYQYEPDTFRLSHLLTTRAGGPSLQDLHYVYDPAANVVFVRDDAQQTSYFAGAVVEPSQTFEYDALYRLTRALGREHIGQNRPPDPWDAERSHQILPGDGPAMQGYEERYQYDLAGNIMKMVHGAGNNGSFVNRWTRDYTYGAADNRLLTTKTGITTVGYTYNPNGSMSALPHLQEMDWSPAERLQHVRQGTLHAYYNYDGEGARLRKVVEKQDGVREVRLYLGDFELFRSYRDGVIVLERETQHVTDDQRRIALVDTRTQGDDGSPARLICFQLANHLGSACVEVDEDAALVSYEEYHPYGSTSWQAGRSLAEVTRKRYRYTGLERDEETGLSYHGARYYASWLGRWTACDPAGAIDGPNLYSYVLDSPTRLHDPSGTQSKADEIVNPWPDDDGSTPPAPVRNSPGIVDPWTASKSEEDAQIDYILGELEAGIGFDTMATRSIPEAAAPPKLKLPPAVRAGADEAWAKSFPNGQPYEQGGYLVRNANGTYSWVPLPNVSKTPNDNYHAEPPRLGPGQSRIAAKVHTHPYVNQADPRIGFSGDDLGTFALKDWRLTVVRASDTYFVAGKTAEFDKLLATYVSQGRQYVLVTEMRATFTAAFDAVDPRKFRAAVEAGIRAVCTKYHLVYYQGVNKVLKQ